MQWLHGKQETLSLVDTAAFSHLVNVLIFTMMFFKFNNHSICNFNICLNLHLQTLSLSIKCYFSLCCLLIWRIISFFILSIAHSLFDVLRNEARVMEGLHRLGIEGPALHNVLKLNIQPSNADYAVDIRNPAILVTFTTYFTFQWSLFINVYVITDLPNAEM